MDLTGCVYVAGDMVGAEPDAAVKAIEDKAALEKGAQEAAGVYLHQALPTCCPRSETRAVFIHQDLLNS